MRKTKQQLSGVKLSSRLRLIVIGATAMVINSACATNVLFYDQVKPSVQNSTIPKTVDLYIDWAGSLYPESGVKSDFRPSRGYQGSLYNYLYTKDAPLCQNASEGTRVDALCGAGKEGFEKLQTQMWSDQAQEILSKFDADSDQRAIILLIHGFNVTQANEQYKQARTAILRADGGETDIVFVQPHWDGYTNIFKRAWSNGQASGPLVGFQLRQLFNAIEEEVETQGTELPAVRVLTHSSGAFVAGATFGNPISALPLLRSADENGTQPYDNFRKNMGSRSNDNPYSIPEIKDLRVGLLAAATSSDTFTGYNGYKYMSEDKEAAGFGIKDATLVFSIMPEDKALSKGPLSPNLSLAGATGLGADREIFCFLSNSDRIKDLNSTVIGMDFERTGQPRKVRTDHGWKAYLDQVQSTDFLNLFLGKIKSSEYEIECNN